MQIEKPAQTKPRLYQDALVIFLFHGVINRSNYEVRNYIRKHIEKDYFYSFLKEVKSSGACLSIDQIVEHHKANKPFAPYSFAITFDDGFENNYSIAAPILKDLSLPAMFYVTTNFIDHNEMSWTDRIELCLEQTKSGALKFEWERAVRKFKSPSEKIQIMDNIRQHVKKDRSIDVGRFVASVFEQCGLEEVRSSADPLDQKMSWGQVRKLHDSDLFSVGGHGHTHRILSFLSERDLRTEIETSLNLLKSKADIQTVHYSYPDGLKHCYNENVISTLKDNGIVCSPSAEEGKNTLNDELFHLKRVMVV